MPKQVLKIDRFEGGINNNADTRDIQQNELYECIDFDISNVGVIQTMGGIAPHSEVPAENNTFEEGYGLHVVSHDRTLGTLAESQWSGTMTASSAEGDPIEHIADAKNKVFSSASDFIEYDPESIGTFLNSNGTEKLTIGCNSLSSVVDGSEHGIYLRGDKIGSSNALVAGRTYRVACNMDASSTSFPSATHVANDDYDVESGLYFKMGNSKSYGRFTALTSDQVVETPITISSVPTGDASSFGNGLYITSRNPRTDNTVLIDNLTITSNLLTDSTKSWTNDELIGATIINVTDGSSGIIDDNTSTTITAALHGGSDNSWDNGDVYYIKNAPKTGDDYLLFSDTDSTGSIDVYSKNKDAFAARLTGLTDIGGGDREDVFYTVDGITRICDANFNNNNENKVYGYYQINAGGQDDSVANKYGKCPMIVDEWLYHSLKIYSPAVVNYGSGTNTDNAIVFNGSSAAAPDQEGEIIIYYAATANDGEWDADGSNYGYKYVSTYVYEGGQESNFSNDFDATDDLSLDMASMVFHIRVYNQSTLFDKRIRGVRLYWYSGPDRIAKQDAHLVFDFDFEKGMKASGSIDGWNEITVGATYLSASCDLVSPPTFHTYQSLNGRYPNENFHARYKTAVVANRRTYIGNIMQNGKIYGDRMLKSPVNQFDIFPPDSFVDASINDGDDIVKLELYADRILQFKKKKLIILNISQDIEFIEDTFMHKGIDNPAAVCKTDYGIAWANKNGVYLYNGENVTNLFEAKKEKKISDSFYEDWISNSTTILTGYIPKKRQIIVSRGAAANASNDNILLFDFATLSWMEGQDKLPGDATSATKTNFVVDWNDDLIFAHTSGTGTIVKWDPTSDATDSALLITKDIDFGAPSIRKKIYKIYISYQGDATNVKCQYSVDGHTSSYANFNRIDINGNSTNATDDAKCFYQGTVGTTDWTRAELKPVSSINNIYSFKIKIYSDSGGGTIASDFKINDISIIYRTKSIK